MDQKYNWNDHVFKDRCGESLNLAVNCITDVLHTLYQETQPVGGIRVTPNNLELWAPYIALASTITLAIAVTTFFFKYGKKQ